jgi:hypothetical protein
LSGLGICLYSPNSFSNQYLNSIIEEHLGDDNDFKHSNIPMKLIRDVNLQFEEETLNLHPQIIPYPQEILDVFHESFELSIIHEENLDDHIILKDLSPKKSEIIKACEEECLENTIFNYHSSRESFHVLISNSFYSLYPYLFLDSGVLMQAPLAMSKQILDSTIYCTGIYLEYGLSSFFDRAKLSLSVTILALQLKI